MRFLIDAQLPPALARWLNDQGHEAVHVADLGLAGGEDLMIWARAVADDTALLTKDEDFISIRRSAPEGPAVCWLRVGNATNPELFAWLQPKLPALLAALAAGETIIEVR